MSERFKELVLKTSDSQEPRVRIPFSPPFLKNQFNNFFKVTIWSSTGVGDGLHIRAHSVNDEARICRRSGQNL